MSASSKKNHGKPASAAAKAAVAAAPAKTEPAKVSLFIQYQGQQTSQEEIISAIHNSWTEAGNNLSDIRTMSIYVKPEDTAVYYVINDGDTGVIYF